MENKSLGKYFLVFEPTDVYHQYAVTFTPSSDVQITKIKKFTDLDYKNNKQVKKNLLGDIDKILVPCSDVSKFFDKYVDSSIFHYNGYNLHNMFIAYKSNGNIKTLKCAINNPKLQGKLEFINGSKFTDQTSIKGLVSFATDPVSSNNFLDFVNMKRNKYETGLSNETYTMLEKLRFYKRTLQNQSDTGVLSPSIALSDQIINKLYSYKEYRELYLLKLAYIEKLNLEKQMLEQEKAKLSIPKINPFVMNENLQAYEQLNIFGEVVPSQKTKRKH